MGEINENVSRETFDNNEGIFIEYNHTPADIINGLKHYNKQVHYKKSVIYTVILSVAFILFLYQSIINDSLSKNGLLLILIFMVVVMIWFIPYQHRKKISKISSEITENYTITIFPDKFVVKIEDGEVVGNFDDDKVKRFVVDDLLIFCKDIQSVYIIPKRCCENNWQALIERI